MGRELVKPEGRWGRDGVHQTQGRGDHGKAGLGEGAFLRSVALICHGELTPLRADCSLAGWPSDLGKSP